MFLARESRFGAHADVSSVCPLSEQTDEGYRSKRQLYIKPLGRKTHHINFC